MSLISKSARVLANHRLLCGIGGHLGISADCSSSGLSSDTKKLAAQKNCSASRFDLRPSEWVSRKWAAVFGAKLLMLRLTASLQG